MISQSLPVVMFREVFNRNFILMRVVAEIKVQICRFRKKLIAINTTHIEIIRWSLILTKFHSKFVVIKKKTKIKWIFNIFEIKLSDWGVFALIWFSSEFSELEFVNIKKIVNYICNPFDTTIKILRSGEILDDVSHR